MNSPEIIETPAHLLRAIELIPSNILDTPITVIGAGAIGSFSVLSLAKMGFNNITVFDFDKVDAVNLGSQFYRFEDVGKQKVLALQDLVKSFTGIEIKAKDERYETGLFEGIVICAVDSMSARKKIMENHALQSFATRFIIDPRMSAEFAAMHCYEPLDYSQVERYKKTLVSDEDAVQERCTAKATMYTVGMISGLVARTVRDFLCSKDWKRSVQWAISVDDLQSEDKTGKALPDYPALLARPPQDPTITVVRTEDTIRSVLHERERIWSALCRLDSNPAIIRSRHISAETVFREHVFPEQVEILVDGHVHSVRTPHEGGRIPDYRVALSQMADIRIGGPGGGGAPSWITASPLYRTSRIDEAMNRSLQEGFAQVHVTSDAPNTPEPPEEDWDEAVANVNLTF